MPVNDEITEFNELEFLDKDSLAVFASDSTPRTTISVSGSEDADAVPVTEIIFSVCLLYTSPSPRDQRGSRMPSSA